MQSWSAVPVIDLTGRSLHYLYSSWLSMTLYVWQTLLNQFSNFFWCLSCNDGTDKQMLSTRPATATNRVSGSEGTDSAKWNEDTDATPKERQEKPTT